MKVIIAGGRKMRLGVKGWTILDALHKEIGFTEVVSGACRGIDKDAESWAKARGIPIKQFIPRWKELGKRAGPTRNAEMAAYAAGLVLFPGEYGTANMKRRATEAGLKIWEHTL